MGHDAKVFDIIDKTLIYLNFWQNFDWQPDTWKNDDMFVCIFYSTRKKSFGVYSARTNQILLFQIRQKEKEDEKIMFEKQMRWRHREEYEDDDILMQLGVTVTKFDI